MSAYKNLISTGTILLAAGAVICGTSFAVSGFDTGRLSGATYETNTYEVNDDFRDISIRADTEKIAFVPSEDKNCRVVCYEDDNEPHKIDVKNGTLTIESTDVNNWLPNISFLADTQKITVYLPETGYGSLSIDADTSDAEIPEDFGFESITVKVDTGDISCRASVGRKLDIKTSTGDITLSDLTAGEIGLGVSTGKIDVTSVNCEGDIDIRVSTGKTTLENVKCENLRSDGSTGGMNLKNVIVNGEMDIERSTGGIKFDGCDAGSLVIETDTGDITGTLLTEKVFVTDTDTGKVSVPQSTSGGSCELKSDTGDIRIELIGG